MLRTNVSLSPNAGRAVALTNDVYNSMNIEMQPCLAYIVLYGKESNAHAQQYLKSWPRHSTLTFTVHNHYSMLIQD